MVRRVTYDSRCHDLAEHFLSDARGSTAEDRHELAEAIQEVCEDFLRGLDCCRACGACPGFIGVECEGDCDHAKREGA